MAYRIRLQIDTIARKVKFIEYGGSPVVWNCTPLNVEFGIFENGAVKSLADFSSIAVHIKPSTRRGADLDNSTVASADLNQAMTLEEWNAGVIYHGVAAFSASDMDLDLGAKNSKTFWLAVIGTDLTSGDPVMLGGVPLSIEESGINLSGNNPTQGANLVPLGAVYNGSGEYVVAVTADLLHAYTKGANDTNVVNGTQTLDVAGTFTSQGSSVTLTGTIGELVTATLRYPVFLNADQTLALVQGNIKTVMEPGQTITLRSTDGLKGVVLGCDANGQLSQLPIDT